jgi:hypothetical protein
MCAKLHKRTGKFWVSVEPNTIQLNTDLLFDKSLHTNTQPTQY